MALVLNVAFTPVDNEPYRLLLYVNGAASNNPQQPVLLEPANSTRQVSLSVPSGATLFGVAAFQRELNQEGRPAYIHAGTAIAPIAGLTQPQSLQVAVHHNNNQLRNLLKGQLTVQPVQVPSVPRNAFNRESLRDRLNLRLADMIQQVYQPLEAYPGAFALSKSLKAQFWYTPAGPLAFPMFASRYNVVMPSENYLRSLLVTAAERHGLSLTTLGALLRAALQGRGNVKLVGKVYSSMLTMYATSLPYRTDYYKKGKREIVTERFDRDKNCESGDCEDFARDIAATHRHMLSGQGRFSNTIMRDMAEFASGYVCALMLGTVTQPSAGVSIRDHEDERSYSGHMYAMLFSREQWGAWQGVQVQPSAWTLAYPQPFVLEGTGFMSSIPQETTEEQRYRNSLERAVSAYPWMDKFSHQITSRPTYSLSPFYRQNMMSYAPPLNDPTGDWVQEFAWIDSSSRHGVTYDTMVKQPQSVRLLRMNGYDQDVKDMCYLALSTLAPERAPRLDAVPAVSETLLGAYANGPTTPTGTPVHFYVPIEPGVGVDNQVITQYFNRVLQTRNPIVSSASYKVENFDINNSQVRVTLWINN